VSSAGPVGPPSPDDPLALAEYAPGVAVALTDAERWPTLDAGGAARLRRVAEHPLAPAWVHRTGDRLGSDAVQRAGTPLPVPGWLDEHLAAARKLPAYRRTAAQLGDLASWPTVTRDDLLDDVSAFVPLDADLDRMIEGSSSGTTGRALQIPDDIEEVARSFHLLVRLVADQGIDWRPDPQRMALAYVVHQRQAFTYTSSISGFDQSTMARLNLHPSQWRAAGQRTGFLVDMQPQVFTGNPTSLAELLHPELVAGLRPLALFSGAMALSAGLRRDLERAYDCPVIDVYGLHETRPIAASADGGPFVILDRRVHVEVLDDAGAPVPPGERGEIVVTAGENPLLPLVRYRTGDFARLVDVAGRPALADLEGREATRFVAADGALVPCVDLTQHLQAGGARGWAVHQAADGSVSATIVGGDDASIGAALGRLLNQPVVVSTVAGLLDLGEGKPRRYLSEAAGR
jgi:phenylacetate-CoA ligase